jgi:hypothetical protein
MASATGASAPAPAVFGDPLSRSTEKASANSEITALTRNAVTIHRT